MSYRPGANKEPANDITQVGEYFRRNTNREYVLVGTHTGLPLSVASTPSRATCFALNFRKLGTLSISSWTPLAVWNSVTVNPGQTAVDVIPLCL